jgi:hypothetical protein
LYTSEGLVRYQFGDEGERKERKIRAGERSKDNGQEKMRKIWRQRESLVQTTLWKKSSIFCKNM